MCLLLSITCLLAALFASPAFLQWPSGGGESTPACRWEEKKGTGQQLCTKKQAQTDQNDGDLSFSFSTQQWQVGSGDSPGLVPPCHMAPPHALSISWKARLGQGDGMCMWLASENGSVIPACLPAPTSLCLCGLSWGRHIFALPHHHTCLYAPISWEDNLWTLMPTSTSSLLLPLSLFFPLDR